jgi:hypothetical protein
MRRLFFVLVLLMELNKVPVLADIAQPKPSRNPTPMPRQTVPINENKELDSSLKITLDKDTNESKLIIPRSLVNDLRAALDNAETGSETMASTNSTNLESGSVKTIFAGIFMSLAIILAGVYLLRRNQLSAKTVSAVAFLLFSFAATSVALANIGPPQEARSITSLLFDRKVFKPYNFASGKIKVQISKDDSKQIILLVPIKEKPGDKTEDEE